MTNIDPERRIQLTRHWHTNGLKEFKGVEASREAKPYKICCQF
jgi:hypothetical protein